MRNGKVELARNEFKPGAGCVGYWDFDEGIGNKTYDTSGMGNNGTINGDENWTEGKFGNALEFDGVDDYIQIPDSETMVPSTEITMEAWIQIEDYDKRHFIINQHSSNAAQCSYEMLIEKTSGKLVASLTDGSEYIFFYSDDAVPINEWIHVAYTWDGTKSANGHSLYINGEKKSKTFANGDPTAFSSITNSPCPVFLGVRGEGFGPRLPAVQDEIIEGRMDEIKLYNRSLSPYEIGQHYNRTPHPTNATITSTPITLPENMSWDSLSIAKTEPANTYINVSIINAEDNTTIQTFDNCTNRTIDISQLNVDEITSIRLKAYFSGNGSATPSLDSWGVEWTAENAWRDSFTGDSKVEYPYGVDEHTMGYWKFEEGCGNVARDISGNGNDGTLTNMEEEDWVDGRIGKALEYDGTDDFVECGGDPSLDITDAITIEAMIKTTNESVGYAGSNDAYGVIGTSAGGYYRGGQSFEFDSPMIVNKVTIRLKVTQPGVGDLRNIEVRIETDNSGVPSGLLVSPSATSIIYDFSSMQYIDKRAQFPSSISLAASTKYWLVCKVSGCKRITCANNYK